MFGIVYVRLLLSGLAGIIATSAPFLHLLLTLLSKRRELGLLLCGQNIVNLRHHAGVRDFTLDARVGSGLCCRAHLSFVESAIAEAFEVCALTASLLALRLRALAVASSYLLNLLFLRIRQVELLGQTPAEEAAAPAAEAPAVPTALAASFAAVLALRRLLLSETRDARESHHHTEGQSAYDFS